jgi:hypothetical protein
MNEAFVTDTAAGFKAPQLSSAEWIEEAPSTNSGVLPLANFGSVTFSNAQYTANGTTGPIAPVGTKGTSLPANVWAIDMADGYVQRGTFYITSWLDSTSVLNSTENGFTVAYGSTTPSAPAASTSNGPNHAATSLISDLAPVSVGAPAGSNVTVAQVALALPGSANSQVITVDVATRAMSNPATQQETSQALAAFFAGNTVAGGMEAPGSGVAVDASAADVQWFAPARGSGAFAPPAMMPPPETREILQALKTVQAEETAREPSLAMSKWNGDPGSTREQPPTCATDMPVEQAAAAFVLLGAVLNSRRRTADEEDAE